MPSIAVAPESPRQAEAAQGSRAALETGICNPDALALDRIIVAKRAPFGGYGPDPLSVFMEKAL